MFQSIIIKRVAWIRVALICGLILANQYLIFTQCNPPPAETCEETVPFCSLDAMNGYTCNNPSSTLTTKNPGCISCCATKRTWWSFVSQGGNASITLTVGNCTCNAICDFGVVFGIYGNCECTEVVGCKAACIKNQSLTHNVNLQPCKTYYIGVDACCECICDLTINTSGGGPPIISPLGFINNVSSGVIEPICTGYCDYKLFVNPQSGGCEPTYVWTLDGNEVGGNSNEIKLDFPNEGDFELCVTAYVGNPQSGSICSQQGPKCAIVKVRKSSDRNGIQRTLCWEQVKSGGYRWHTQTINLSGIYKEEFIDNNCCPYDSVVQFNVLPEPIPAEVYYITCDDKPYIDILNRPHTPCRDKFEILLPKTNTQFKCDSSIKLTAINVEFSPQWSVICQDSLVEISPEVNIDKPCNVGETYQFDYRWYRKSDSSITLGIEDKLLIKPLNDSFCVEVKVKTEIGNKSGICSQIFCESINESEYLPICFPLAGDTALCKGVNALYRIDTLLNINGLAYNWTITGGTLISKPDSAIIEVKWNLATGDTGKVCVFYNSDCGKSCEKCLRVLTGTSSNPYAGPDDSICDFTYKFKGIKDKGGYWKQISGSVPSVIQDSTNPNSDLLVSESGTYQFIYVETLGACINADTVILSFNKVDTSGLNVALIYCDSTTINGQLYTQTSKFTQQLKSFNGCDSLVNTELTINKSSDSNLNLQGCDSITVNNQVYYQSGIYTQNLINSDNCDSLLNLNLTIGKTTRMDFKMSGCDSLVIGGSVYYQSGVYPISYQSIDNCDSLVNFDLTIYKTQRDSLSLSDCDTVVYKGKIHTQTGDYPEFYTSVNGCDSIVNVQINITSSNNAQLNETKCDSVTINGIYYDQSGNYTQKLKSANGCDSTLNINLTIGIQSSYNYKLTSCDSAFIIDKWYYQTGNYTKKLVNTFQCDSTLNIDLTINNSTSGDTLFRSCDSVIINGITYNQTGIYTQMLVNSIQCDSVLIIDFTKLSKSSTNLKYKACDSLFVNGILYNQSGIYSQILSNANQCDSLLNLDINITKSNSKDSIALGCDSLTFNGQTYHVSGSYNQELTNAELCDSILNLHLTIYKSSLINYSAIACDAINLNGKVFTRSGSYNQYLKDIHQCDSVLNIQLLINRSDSITLTKNACDSILVNGVTYYSSGQFKQDLKTSSGCDSTITLDLTIKAGNPTNLIAGKDTSICEGDVIKLAGIFSGPAAFNWLSNKGSFDNPQNINTNYYADQIGSTRVYLHAADDCKQWLDSFEVIVLPKQIVQITGDTIIDPCKEIRFTAIGGNSYTWTPSTFIECLDPPCSKVKLISFDNTRFTISTDGPCATPASLNLSLSQIASDIYLPNIFSPNGDDINDLFLPTVNCELLTFYHLQIFDRWGNLLFESKDKTIGWDGNANDVKMIPGVYPYVVEFEVHSQRKIKTGDLTLIR